MSLLLFFGGSAAVVEEEVPVEEEAAINPNLIGGWEPWVIPRPPTVYGHGRTVIAVCRLQGTGTVTSPDEGLIGLGIDTDDALLGV